MTRGGVVVLKIGDRLKVGLLAQERQWMRVVEIDPVRGGATVVPDDSAIEGPEWRLRRGIFV